MRRAHEGVVVFLIEDDLAIRHMVRKTIERDQPQWSLLEASDGLEALEHREWLEEADVIITDLEMPRMGGRELIDHLFRDSQLGGKSVIIFSGSSEGGLREHWGKNHTLHYMDKTCHPKDLVERVRALVMAKGVAQKSRGISFPGELPAWEGVNMTGRAFEL
jgi:CheY-like chemotaxis protein